jgi:hypothetical protein
MAENDEPEFNHDEEEQTRDEPGRVDAARLEELENPARGDCPKLGHGFSPVSPPSFSTVGSVGITEAGCTNRFFILDATR